MQGVYSFLVEVLKKEEFPFIKFEKKLKKKIERKLL